MFPWVYGFQWSPGHVIFTGVFLFVALVVVATLILAAFRSLRDFRRGQAAKVAWHSQFHDLPAADRACRHALTGERKGRVCEQDFDCRQCQMHSRLAAQAPTDPAGRLYHRGHTWVEPTPDGDLLIGLDDIAARLLGPVEHAEVPAPGAPIETNSPAFTLRKRGAEFRVLAPVDGTVLESNPSARGWLARVRPPAGASLAHLLAGEEASAWLASEIDRLQMAAAQAGAAPSLADGGVLKENLSASLPPRVWESVCGEILLDA